MKRMFLCDDTLHKLGIKPRCKLNSICVLTTAEFSYYKTFFFIWANIYDHHLHCQTHDVVTTRQQDNARSHVARDNIRLLLQIKQNIKLQLIAVSRYNKMHSVVTAPNQCSSCCSDVCAKSSLRSVLRGTAPFKFKITK